MTEEQRNALAEFIGAAVLINYHGPVKGEQWRRLGKAQSALQVAFSVTEWNLADGVTKSVRTSQEAKP